MKKRLQGFLLGVIITSVSLSAFPAFAAGITKKIDVILNAVSVKVNSQNLSGDNIVYNGNVYIQAQKISDSLGKTYTWDKKANIVTINDKAVQSTNQYSYSNPAPINTKQVIQVKGLLQTYKAEMTVEEILRGEEAWTKIKDANMFNDAAPAGFEYILAKINFNLLDINNDEQLDLNGAVDIKLISSAGKEYEAVTVVSPEPQMSAKLYKGASSEGWAVYKVKADDKQPKLVFGRDYNGKGGIWFKAYK